MLILDLFLFSQSQAGSPTPSAVALVQQGLNAQKSKNDKLAFQCFRKAANLGNPKAQFFLGEAYFFGRGEPQDYDKALVWLKKATAGNLNARKLLFQFRYIIFSPDLKMVLASNSQADVQQGLAAYQAGDKAKAFSFFRKAAERGDLGAQNYLSVCYEYGEGVTKDESQSIKWLKKSAEQGDAESQCYLANGYKNGMMGSAIDYGQVEKWYEKSAAQGYSDAEYSLGNCYEDGEGITPSVSEAMKWYRKAAAQGNKEAKAALTRVGSEAFSLVVKVNDENFDQEVLKADKPVLVDCYATWCGPCRAYGPIIDKIAVKYKNKLKVVRVDVDKSPKLSKKYNIESIPHSMIYEKGKLLGGWVGLKAQENVEKELKEKLVFKN